jgi:hypothetical protein
VRYVRSNPFPFHPHSPTQALTLSEAIAPMGGYYESSTVCIFHDPLCSKCNILAMINWRRMVFHSHNCYSFLDQAKLTPRSHRIYEKVRWFFWCYVGLHSSIKIPFDACFGAKTSFDPLDISFGFQFCSPSF